MGTIKCCCRKRCDCMAELDSLLYQYHSIKKQKKVLEETEKELKQDIMEYLDEEVEVKTREFRVKWKCTYQERLNKELAKKYLTDSMIKKCCNTSRYVTLTATKI